MDGTPVASWEDELERWLAPFLARLRRQAQRHWAPFYLKGVAPPHVTINEIFRGVMPYLFLVEPGRTVSSDGCGGNDGRGCGVEERQGHADAGDASVRVHKGRHCVGWRPGGLDQASFCVFSAKFRKLGAGWVRASAVRYWGPFFSIFQPRRAS